jgi:hypothetical protein
MSFSDKVEFVDRPHDPNKANDKMPLDIVVFPWYIDF